MTCLLFIIVDMLICFVFPKTQVLGGTVGCVLNLEGKLEFLSYFALVFVPHWIGDGRLVYILTPLMPIVMSVGPWATSPHARTYAEPNQGGPGSGSDGARPRPVDTNAVRFKGLLNVRHFFGF